MKLKDFDFATVYAMQKLQTELLPQLHYHCIEHTRDEVVVWTGRLADLEAVEGNERLILITAAYFHDIGWTQIRGVSDLEYAKRLEHEFIGSQLAREILPQIGFSRSETEAVCELILVTRLAEIPVTLSEKIIRDADLSSIGQGVDQFWKRGNDLRAEMNEFGISIDDNSWNLIELDLLESMTYFTRSARYLFDDKKQAALESVRALLGYK